MSLPTKQAKSNGFIRLRDAVLEMLDEPSKAVFNTFLADALYNNSDAILTGSVDIGHRITILRDTIKLTADRLSGDKKYANLASKIWNPVVAAALLLNTEVETTSKSETISPRERPKVQKDPKPKPSKVEKPQQAPLSLMDMGPIYAELNKISSKSNPLVSNTIVDCDKKACKFCRDLFRQVHISPCIGHRRCSKVGYYAHIGVGLWHSLSFAHSRGHKCEMKNRPLKPGTYPSINTYLDSYPLEEVNNQLQKMEVAPKLVTPILEPEPLEDEIKPSSSTTKTKLEAEAAGESTPLKRRRTSVKPILSWASDEDDSRDEIQTNFEPIYNALSPEYAPKPCGDDDESQAEKPFG